MDERALPVCPLCNGARWKYKGTTSRPSICLKLSMLDNYLGPDLSGAAKIRESPLYAINAGFQSTLDRTSENLHIHSTWHRLLPHLRLSIGHRHWLEPNFRFSIITDERIKNVFVGNESYKQRSSKVRDDKDSYNGLKDLVESHDLMIIRLGFLGYKNVAAPGALKEALMIRDAAHKPTWVVQNPEADLPKSWDEEVSGYLSEHFDIVDMQKLDKSPEPPPTMHVEPYDTAPPSPRGRPPASKPPSSNESGPDPMDMMTGGGDKKPKYTKPKKKRWGNDEGGGSFSGGGGLPV